jgi:hypothetical protein
MSRNNIVSDRQVKHKYNGKALGQNVIVGQCYFSEDGPVAAIREIMKSQRYCNFICSESNEWKR